MTNPHTLIQKYYQAFNDGDMEAFFSFLSEDVVHDLNQGKREVGKAVFKHFMDRMNRCYKEKIVDIVIFVNERGDRAAAEFVVEGKYIATDQGLPPARGQTYKLAGGAFFALKGGKISRITNYYNLPAWLDQVK